MKKKTVAKVRKAWLFNDKKFKGGKFPQKRMALIYCYFTSAIFILFIS
jgi:hypothetical protein